MGEWETTAKEEFEGNCMMYTARFEVPGGFIYRVLSSPLDLDQPSLVSLVFVPIQERQ